jgi:hypothetical protein
LPARENEDSDSYDHVVVEDLDRVGFEEEDWQYTFPSDEDIEDIEEHLGIPNDTSTE